MPRPSWKEAIRQTTEYRDYLKPLTVNEELKTLAYLITKESLDKLLTQNGQSLDGIRIYIGQDTINGDRLIRLVPVATKRIVVNGIEVYDDYITYGGEPKKFTSGSSGEFPPDPEPDPDNFPEERPCPNECSPPNPLKPPSKP